MESEPRALSSERFAAFDLLEAMAAQALPDKTCRGWGHGFPACSAERQQTGSKSLTPDLRDQRGSVPFCQVADASRQDGLRVEALGCVVPRPHAYGFIVEGSGGRRCFQSVACS